MELFRLCDADGDGLLSWAELHTLADSCLFGSYLIDEWSKICRYYPGGMSKYVLAILLDDRLDDPSDDGVFFTNDELQVMISRLKTVTRPLVANPQTCPVEASASAASAAGSPGGTGALIPGLAQEVRSVRPLWSVRPGLPAKRLFVQSRCLSEAGVSGLAGLAGAVPPACEEPMAENWTQCQCCHAVRSGRGMCKHQVRVDHTEETTFPECTFCKGNRGSCTCRCDACFDHDAHWAPAPSLPSKGDSVANGSKGGGDSMSMSGGDSVAKGSKGMSCSMSMSGGDSMSKGSKGGSSMAKGSKGGSVGKGSKDSMSMSGGDSMAKGSKGGGDSMSMSMSSSMAGPAAEDLARRPRLRSPGRVRPRSQAHTPCTPEERLRRRNAEILAMSHAMPSEATPGSGQE